MPTLSDKKFYVEELTSEECQCGKTKKSGFSFCYFCYYLLPRDMQRDLYNQLGHGYEEAYDAAVEFLNS